MARALPRRQRRPSGTRADLRWAETFTDKPDLPCCPW